MNFDYIVVGEFDAQKYNISFNLMSKEVILTKNRLYHIFNKHIEVVKYIKNLKYILNNLDEIFVEKSEVDTIWIVKEMKDNVKITLKLNTIERGKNNYKNSIIQMQILDKKRVEKYLNNNRVKKVFAKEKVI